MSTDPNIDPFPNGEDRKMALLAARNLADAQQELMRYQAEGAICNLPYGDAETMAWLAEAVVHAGRIESDMIACQPCYADYRDGLNQLIAAAAKFLSDHHSAYVIDPRDIVDVPSSGPIDDIADADLPF